MSLLMPCIMAKAMRLPSAEKLGEKLMNLPDSKGRWTPVSTLTSSMCGLPPEKLVKAMVWAPGDSRGVMTKLSPLVNVTWLLPSLSITATFLVRAAPLPDSAT